MISALLLLASLLGFNANAAENGVGLTISFPHVYDLSFERLARSSHWSFGVGAGYLPTINLPLSPTIGVATKNLDLTGRWHPLGGAFFLGLSLGYQNISASATDSINGIPVDATISIGNFFAAPHVGWIWELGHFMFGFDLGKQYGFGGNSKFGFSITDPNYQNQIAAVQATTAYQSLVNKIQNGFAKIGDKKLLYFAFRLGWVF